MRSQRRNNVLILQSGGCTAVMNLSLAGIMREVLASTVFGQVYGAEHGLRGLLDAPLLDLRRQSAQCWKAIGKMPGAVLGSGRRRLQREDEAKALDVLEKHRVGYLFVIGGNDSADTAHRLGRAAGQELVAALVPKSIDNDLPATDHSPGYGSAARFVALATMGAGRDAEAMGVDSPITVVEVMGRNAGWLAASAALTRRQERDAPHIICLPEVPVQEERLVAQVEETYRRWGFVVIVVSENSRGPNGPLGSQSDPFYVDDFGHPYYEGPARYLAQLIGSRLKVRTRFEKPGTIQRSILVSKVDAEESFWAGQQAVKYALNGHTDVMVALVRAPEGPYRCTARPVPLAEVAEREKFMPAEYLDVEGQFVTSKFLAYARPLVGKLPRSVRL